MEATHELDDLPRSRVTDLDSLWAEIASLKVNDGLQAGRIRDLEKCLDTLQTPLRKRVWWWVYEGWPWHDLNAAHRQPRPWFKGR